MKKLLLAFLTVVLCSISSSAQFIWQKTYGPFYSMNLSKMIALKNGGYIFVGRQFAGPPAQVAPGYIVRTNENSDTLWVKKYLISGASFTNCHNVVEDSDGNLLVVGDWVNNNSSTINTNGFLYKLNSNGDTLWTRKIITPQRDTFSSVIIGHDNSYLVAAQIAGSTYIQKYSKQGIITWSKLFPFSLSDPGRIGYVHKASSGYFVFVNSGGNSSVYETKIYKIDEHGNEQNSRRSEIYDIYDIVTDKKQNLLVCANGSLSKNQFSKASFSIFFE